MSITANRGEWAELYALVKLLVDNAVPAVDKKLNPIPGKFFRFLELIRQDEGTMLHFVPFESRQHSQPSGVLPDRDFLVNTNAAFLREIQAAEGRAFESQYGTQLMKALGIRSIKANSTEKVDLYARLAGLEGSDDRKLGFSIKSQIGATSTLLNASGQTHIVYSVVGTTLEAATINAIKGASKIKDRIKAIYDSGGVLEFDSITSTAFSNNLDLIEGALKENLAKMLVASYRIKNRTLVDTLNYVAANSGDDQMSKKLNYQIKNFLRAVALGMVPGTAWSGDLVAYGGYLVIKPNGQIGCFHLQKDDEFKDYLLESTKFDTPASRTNFGEIYSTASGLKFNLNLQIRFL